MGRSQSQFKSGRHESQGLRITGRTALRTTRASTGFAKINISRGHYVGVNDGLVVHNSYSGGSEIPLNPAPAANNILFSVVDGFGAPIFQIPAAGGPAVYGDKLRAGTGVFGPFMSMDGTTNPPSLKMASGGRLWGGAGSPTDATNGILIGPASVGDLWYDSTIHNGSSLGLVWSVCSAAGTPGTWQSTLKPSITDVILSNNPFGLSNSESIPRRLLNNNAITITPSATLQVSAVALPANAKLSSFSWLSGSTAAVTPTHQWMGLYDVNGNLLARSADVTSRAIAANAQIGYAIAKAADGVTSISSFTTTYNGLYYLSLVVGATGTMPTATGYTGLASANGSALSGVVAGTSANGSGIPPSTAFSLGTLTVTANNIYMGIR